MRVVLDTNVLGAAFYEGDPNRKAAIALLDLLDREGHEIWLPTVVVAELAVFFLEQKSDAEWETFLRLLRQGDRYRTVPLDIGLADAAGHVRAEEKLKIPDAIVAAAAIALHADMLITNDRGFRRLRDRLKVETVRSSLRILRAGLRSRRA